MRLRVIHSNSQGNAYILYSEQEALLIEAGVNFKKIQQALRFNLRKVVGCLVTHEHGDHSVAVPNLLKAGISVYATNGTHTALGTATHYRSKKVQAGVQFNVGSFTVMPFDVKHDVAEPVGFLIHHKECGMVLFMTDTYMNEFEFQHQLHNVIIEANYSQAIADARVAAGEDPKFLRDRTIVSHMSLDTCKGVLRAQDLSQVNNIVLIHLSDRTSDHNQFKREVAEATGKTVHIAVPGLDIEFNKSPF